MALTTAQEYTAVREAIQAIVAGAGVATVNVGGLSITYHADRLDWLTDREEILARRLAIKNARKRVFPDFT